MNSVNPKAYNLNIFYLRKIKERNIANRSYLPSIYIVLHKFKTSKMKQIKLLLVLCVTFSIFSCQQEQEGKVIYSETFNQDELEDSPDSDNEFIEKYADYLKSTIEIYKFENADIIAQNSTVKTESNTISQIIEFKFEYSVGKSNYFIKNSLAKHYNLNDIETGWKSGENLFWSEILNENTQKENFTEYKNDKVHSMGDYSEYSELKKGNMVMIILHIKWRKLIIYFHQLIEVEQKDKLIEKINYNFEKIKDTYSVMDQKQIDQLVDVAIDEIEKQD